MNNQDRAGGEREAEPQQQIELAAKEAAQIWYDAEAEDRTCYTMNDTQYAYEDGYLAGHAAALTTLQGEVERLSKALTNLIAVIDRDLSGRIDNDDLATATGQAKKALNPTPHER